MKKAIRDILIFSLGFAAGACLADWKLRSVYEKRYEKESADLQEHFKKRNEALDQVIEEKSKEKGFAMAMSVYKTESDPEDVRKPEEAVEIIKPDQFGDEDEYETSFLTYYADGKLAFDNEKTPVEQDDIPGLIGDALNHFGEFMPGAIHVRNHNYHKDYEILQARQNFCDLYPSMEEDE